jgi:hypothetical protein
VRHRNVTAKKQRIYAAFNDIRKFLWQKKALFQKNPKNFFEKVFLTSPLRAGRKQCYEDHGVM